MLSFCIDSATLECGFLLSPGTALFCPRARLVQHSPSPEFTWKLLPSCLGGPVRPFLTLAITPGRQTIIASFSDLPDVGMRHIAGDVRAVSFVFVWCLSFGVTRCRVTKAYLPSFYFVLDWISALFSLLFLRSTSTYRYLFSSIPPRSPTEYRKQEVSRGGGT